jgi:hypothetical protein
MGRKSIGSRMQRAQNVHVAQHLFHFSNVGYEVNTDRHAQRERERESVCVCVCVFDKL